MTPTSLQNKLTHIL